MDPERKRLKWRCRRGMRELDVVLEAFIDHEYDAIPSREQQQFRQLVDATDLDLYRWLTGRDNHPDRGCQALIERMLARYRYQLRGL